APAAAAPAPAPAPVPPAPAPVAAKPAPAPEKPAPTPTATYQLPAAPAAKAPTAPPPTATYQLDAPPAPRPPAPAPQARPAAPAQKPQAPKPAPAVKHAPAAPKPAPAPAARPGAAPAAGAQTAPAEKPALKSLKVTTLITVRELAEKMEVKVNDLIKKLMGLGVFVTINQRLDSETAVLVASDFGYDLEVTPLHMEAELQGKIAAEKDKPENLKPRPPVVTIMGHVDHGKTSLLDAIRQANVAAGESGGITQHIGAYKVATPKGDIVFLDTPGHEAFTAMRARGAKVTDIVVLVVSAADGVMPQTVEAIDHAKAAGVPILVAVNKIDLPTAQPQKIRQELSSHGLLSEEWGGKHIFVDLSAKKKLNIDKLLDMLLLQAEVLELKADPLRPAVGTVIEAQMDKKRGTVATVLIQSGVVKVGDPFILGLASGRVKALVTDRGDRLQEAGPSTPVEILGINGPVPQAGDAFSVVASESMAKDIAGKRERIHREEALAHRKHVTLLGLKNRKIKELPIILKADVQGSVEALKDSLEKLSTPEISVRVLHAGLGNANESDIVLAEASDAIVLLFHVDSDTRATEMAEKQGVEVRRYEIIYDLAADVKAALEGLLEPEIVDVSVGRVEIRQVFSIRGGKIAGCFVSEGKAVRGADVKIYRAGALLGAAKLETLKRFKDDAKEVEKGMECGVALAGFKDWNAGDTLEVIVKEKRVRRLQPAA
ncbi:MAG TPA: translation initiation factor IF-2, partial [Elusimicrobiota bacterium]|nr:translation initiation factor IF-2 [Elusimicrobiota bacterium]